MSPDDAVQTCAEVFARCLRYSERCGGRIDSPKWFMAIFKRSVANEFNTLAAVCGRTREAEASYAAEEAGRGAGTDYNLGPLYAALAGASEELRQVVRAVAVAPAELLELMQQGADDTSWSRRLCRLCGISPREGLVAELRELLEDK